MQISNKKSSQIKTNNITGSGPVTFIKIKHHSAHNSLLLIAMIPTASKCVITLFLFNFAIPLAKDVNYLF